MSTRPNPPQKSNRLFWIIFVGLSTCALIWAFGDSDTPTKSVKKKKPVVSKTTKKEAYLPEDYKTQFVSLNEAPKNAFQPLVIRMSAMTAKGGNSNGIPKGLTGGDANWVYSGMAAVDGKAMGLVENTSTGDGVFLTEGQTWKTAKVTAITPEKLVFDSPMGTVTVMVGDNATSGPVASNNPGLAPVNPPLNGPIGQGGVGQLNVSPLPIPGQPGGYPGQQGNALSVAPNNMGGNGGWGGRRGGRGRGMRGNGGGGGF